MVITEINSELITLSIVSLNLTTHTLSSGGMPYGLTPTLSLLTSAWGVEMSIGVLISSDRAVAEAPIIWFITSHTADMFISSNSKLSVTSRGRPIS